MNFSTASAPERISFRKNLWLILFATVFSGVWISTFAGTSNLGNWFMENTLVFIFLFFLTLTYRRFRFSDLSYLFITVYLCLHVYGSKYTYAENPFGYWLKDLLHLQRNHYDRIVHFSFGFMLAYPMRDFFLNKMEWPKWVGFVLPCEITLSFSAMYELIEWAVADILFPAEGDAYLGSQGDIWDAQKDMCLAFLGSILIMLLTVCVKKLGKKI